MMLVVGTNTPLAWGETPEERCKRETEAYNKLWKDAWVKNHPEEVARGEQPPSPTPPYQCFGNDNPTPTYTPPPGAATPPAGGTIPGSGSPAGATLHGSGGVAGGTTTPGFLPESPNPLDTTTSPASPGPSPYGYNYADTWTDHTKHPPPPSSSPTGNSLTTTHGNGPTATGNGTPNTGNGLPATGYTLDCDMGPNNIEDGAYRGMGCLGKMPAMGAFLFTRSTYPLPSNTHRVFTRVVMSTDSLPVRAEAPAYAVDDGFYDNTPPFPAGHRLYIPKADPKHWQENGYASSTNRALVCVSKDIDQFGCLRTDNHGFYLDRYGTHTF